MLTITRLMFYYLKLKTSAHSLPSTRQCVYLWLVLTRFYLFPLNPSVCGSLFFKMLFKLYLTRQFLFTMTAWQKASCGGWDYIYIYIYGSVGVTPTWENVFSGGRFLANVANKSVHCFFPSGKGGR